MRLILLSGRARSGKDTVASFMERFLHENNNTVLIVHYADVLKFICKQFFGWNGFKDDGGRALLQKVGTDIIRDQRPEYFVTFLCDLLEMFKDKWDYVIIPDARFENEVIIPEFIYGFPSYHIRVERPNFDNGLTREEKEHASETSLDLLLPDGNITNDGTLWNLRDKTIHTLKELLHEFNDEKSDNNS